MQLHASCVAFAGKAILIRGASGSGKSGLALQLMAMGARLVADDRVELSVADGTVHAEAPQSLPQLIEARGIGLLNADICATAQLHTVVDMNEIETERIPERRHTDLLGVRLPLLHKVESPYFAAAMRQYVLFGLCNK